MVESLQCVLPLFHMFISITNNAVLIGVIRPAVLSVVIAVTIEIPLLIFMALFGCERFAFFLSQSDDVSRIVAHMWRTIDW